MTRLLLIALLIAFGLPVSATEGRHVPAGDLVAAARTLLEAKASADKVPATFALVGRVSDLSLPGAGAPEVRAGELNGAWLRPRVGVPVSVNWADEKTTTVTVWFAVTAPAQAAVYESAYARLTPASVVRMHIGTVDLARARGSDGASAESVVGRRLRRAVLANAAVLADDFESIPAVQVQQTVRIDAGTGVVRLSTKGRALSDGAIGQVIAVLPASASQPVRARVVSDQVVTIEN